MMTEKQSIILRSSVADRVPTVNQLETTLLGLGYNRADAKLYGLKVSGGTKIVVELGGTGGGDPYTHPSYTAITASLTGATVLASFTTDAIGSVTGLTTRTLTAADLGITVPTQFWRRNGTLGELSPITTGDWISVYSADELELTTVYEYGLEIYSKNRPGVISSYNMYGITAGAEFRRDVGGGNYTGSGYALEGIRITWKAGGYDWSAANHGSTYEIATCNDTGNSLLSRFFINNHGNVVIGHITSNNFLHVDSFSGSHVTTILTGEGKVPNYAAYRESNLSYLAANTVLGFLSWQGKGGGYAHAVEISATTGTSSWSGTNMGSTVNIKTIAVDSLSLVSRIRISDSGDVIINDGGAATSFRITGDNETYLLFADGVNDRIGIGESAPDTRLHVKAGSSWGQSLVKIEQTDVDKGFIEFTGTSSSNQTKNISTTPGAGAIVGPKYKTEAADGWEFNCMIRQTVNGSDVWFAGYTPIAAS